MSTRNSGTSRPNVAGLSSIFAAGSTSESESSDTNEKSNLRPNSAGRAPRPDGVKILRPISTGRAPRQKDDPGAEAKRRSASVSRPPLDDVQRHSSSGFRRSPSPSGSSRRRSVSTNVSKEIRASSAGRKHPSRLAVGSLGVLDDSAETERKRQELKANLKQKALSQRHKRQEISELQRTSSPSTRTSSPSTRTSSPSSHAKHGTSQTVPGSPRATATIDRTALELETQTLARKVEVLNQDKEALKSSVDLYETRLRTVANQLGSKDEDFQLRGSSGDNDEIIKEDYEGIARKEAEKLRRDFKDRKLQLEKLRGQLSHLEKTLFFSEHGKDHSYQMHSSVLQEQMGLSGNRNPHDDETSVATKENQEGVDLPHRASLISANTDLVAARSLADEITNAWEKTHNEAEARAQELFEYKGQVLRLKERLHTTGKELSDTRRQKIKLEEDRARQRDSFRNMISSFESELTRAKKYVEKLESKLSEKDSDCEKQMEKLRQQLAMTKKELADVKTEREQDNEVLVEQLRLAQAKSKEAETKCVLLESKCASLAEMSYSTNDTDNKVATLKHELSLAQAKCKKTEEKSSAMKEKLEATAKKHEEYRNQIASLKQGMSSVHTDESNKMFEEYQTQLLALHKSLVYAQEHAKKAEDKEMECQQKLEATIEEKEAVRKELSQLKSAHEKAEKELNKMADMHSQYEVALKKQSEYKSQGQTLMMELSDAQSNAKKTNAEIQELEQKIASLKEDKKEDRERLLEQQENLRSLTTQVSALTAMHTEAVHKLQEATLSKEETEKRAAELEWELSESNRKSMKDLGFKNKVQELKEALKIVQAQVESGKEQTSLLEKKLQTATAELEKQTQSASDISKEYDKSKNLMTALELEVSIVQKRLTQAEKKKTELHQQLEEMTQIKKKLEDEVVNLSSELSNAEDDLSKLPKLEEEMKAMKLKEMEYEGQVKQLKADLLEVRSSVHESLHAVLKLGVVMEKEEKALGEKQQLISDIKRPMGNGYEQKQLISSSTNPISVNDQISSTNPIIAHDQSHKSLMDELMKAHQQIVKKEREFSTKLKEQQQYYEDIKLKLEEKVKNLSENLESVKEQLVQMKAARKALQHEVKRGDDLSQEIQRMQNHIVMLEKERDSLQYEIETNAMHLGKKYEFRIEDLHREINARDEKIEKLEDLLMESETQTACFQSEFEHDIKARDKKLLELEGELRTVEEKVRIETVNSQAPPKESVKMTLNSQVFIFASCVVLVGLLAALNHDHLAFDALPYILASLPADARAAAACAQVVNLLPLCPDMVINPSLALNH